MTIALFDIPDDPQELAPWLERQLTGPSLRELVQELLAFGADSSRQVSLESLVGGRLPEVLSRGLTALPPETVRQVLRHPLTLLELQEQALFSGGEHWQRLAAVPWPGEVRSPRSDDSEAARRPPTGAEAGPISTFAPARVSRGSWIWGLAGMAVAASVVLGLTIWMQPPAPASGWGFDRPGALVDSGTAAEYLVALSRSAEEWFRKRPETRDTLEQRIVQFRHGCETLLQAPHRPLSAGQKAALAQACATTIAELDVLVARLRSGEGEILVTRDDSDRVIRKLIARLHDLAGGMLT